MKEKIIFISECDILPRHKNKMANSTIDVQCFWQPFVTRVFVGIVLSLIICSIIGCYLKQWWEDKQTEVARRGRKIWYFNQLAFFCFSKWFNGFFFSAVAAYQSAEEVRQHLREEEDCLVQDEETPLLGEGFYFFSFEKSCILQYLYWLYFVFFCLFQEQDVWKIETSMKCQCSSRFVCLWKKCS